MRRGRLVALLLAAVAPASAWAQEAPGCDPEALKGPAYTQCLNDAADKSETALKTEFDAAMASIATRQGVFDSQRALWRNSLSDSENLWVRLRNFECQNVAPFEGQTAGNNALKNRVAAFDAKLQCTIRMNMARGADLAHRYPAP